MKVRRIHGVGPSEQASPTGCGGRLFGTVGLEPVWTSVRVTGVNAISRATRARSAATWRGSLRNRVTVLVDGRTPRPSLIAGLSRYHTPCSSFELGYFLRNRLFETEAG